jgi:hypothetical protein
MTFQLKTTKFLANNERALATALTTDAAIFKGKQVTVGILRND